MTILKAPQPITISTQFTISCAHGILWDLRNTSRHSSESFDASWFSLYSVWFSRGDDAQCALNLYTSSVISLEWWRNNGTNNKLPLTWNQLNKLTFVHVHVMHSISVCVLRTHLTLRAQRCTANKKMPLALVSIKHREAERTSLLSVGEESDVRIVRIVRNVQLEMHFGWFLQTQVDVEVSPSIQIQFKWKIFSLALLNFLSTPFPFEMNSHGFLATKPSLLRLVQFIGSIEQYKNVPHLWLPGDNSMSLLSFICKELDRFRCARG